MPEVSVLERKRFVISEESMEMMKQARSAIDSLQVEYPYLRGVGFFGSRTKRIETPDSDLDAVVFVDSNSMSGERNISEELVDLRKSILKLTGLPLGDHAGWAMDLSQEKTDMDIYNFFNYGKSSLRGDIKAKEVLGKLHATENLFSRFFLSVGAGVYENRRYILDQFEKNPRGDEYFGLLMGSLASFERHNRPEKVQVPQYTAYPQTISDAREYFLTESQLST